jgi:hypothetical protein
MLKEQQNRPVSLSFQFTLITITIVVFSYCIYKSFTSFATRETPIKIKKLTPQLIKQFGEPPGQIDIGLIINDFLTFDTVKNDFVAVGTVWFEYDPGTITIDVLSKFRFNRAEIIEKLEPVSRIVNNKFIVSYGIKIRFKNPLSYQFFPFDDHRISLELVNQYLSITDINFDAVASNFSTNASTKEQGWTIVNKEANPGYLDAEGKEGQEEKAAYPVVAFSTDYLRTGIRHAFTILLPLMALFFISLFSFSLNPLHYATLAISLSAGSVTGLLAYRFVIESISPVVGYFMMSDYIYLLFLAAVSLVFLLNIIALNLMLWIKQILIFIIHLFVCSLFIYLTLIWTSQ